ncbi:MAG: hypothetical protein NTY64_20965, partial [Deltaproteobacteria bacterium]|nr:hypothetical protein [Deltaproteobacteria bacterium]
MNSPAQPASVTQQELSYQILSGEGSSRSHQGNGLIDQAVQKLLRERNDSPNEEALRAAGLNFEEKTQKLYQPFHSFAFPEGDIPSRYRIAFVSNSDSLTAQAEADATVSNYWVEIDRLATAQTNRSKVLVSDEPTVLDEGTYNFTLTVGDESYSLSVGVKKTGIHPDTNRDVLRRLARVISAADSTLAASVIETTRKVYSPLSDGLTEDVAHLEIRNKDTGNQSSFSLEDASGGVVTTLELDHMAEGGTQLQYRWNSIQSTSQTNTVALDEDRLRLAFLGPTEEANEIIVKAGLKPLKEKIAVLFSTFDDYIEWIDTNSHYFKSSPKTPLL